MTRRMQLRMLVAALTAAATCLLVMAGGSSMSAFTGAVRNSSNSVSTAYRTCLGAEQGDGASRIYSLTDAISGGKNQGAQGGDATLWSNLAVNFGSGGGCLRDAPQSYFSVGPGLLGVVGRWVTGGGALTIAPGSAITQEVWFRTKTQAGLLMGFGDNPGTLAGLGSSTATGLQVFLTSDGRLDFATSAGTGELVATAPGGAGAGYADGNWHHVVGVYDNGKKWLYVDGVLSASGQGATARLSNMYWRLGYDNLSGWHNTSGSNYLTGGMQWAALYTKALTADQVRAHYLAGTH